MGGPAAILFAAIIAWIAQTRISIRRATLDFISAHEIGNPEWDKATRLFLERTAGDDAATALIALLKPQTEVALAERHAVASVLNHYEGVAVGIKHKAISEKIYKDWNGSNFVDTWNKANAYITARRQMGSRDSAYRHFQDLATKWMEEGVRPDSATDRAPAVQKPPPPKSSWPDGRPDDVPF